MFYSHMRLLVQLLIVVFEKLCPMVMMVNSVTLVSLISTGRVRQLLLLYYNVESV